MDSIKKSLTNNKFVFWEEIARDGAQAKTILSKEQRVEIAKLHSQIFGENANKHLVFAAGFISISPQEQEVITYVAENVSECQIAVNTRSHKDEILLAIKHAKKAKYPRLAVVMPGNDRLGNIMIHKTGQEIFDYNLDILKFCLDKAQDIPVDVQLAAAYEGSAELIAEFSNMATELGAATIGLGDTCGKIYPNEIDNFYSRLLAYSSKNILYAPHLHNDLGFAIDNTFIGIRHGINFACTSWLGLGERVGLARTELLTFLLAYDNKKSIEKLGFDTSNLFYSEPNLKLLPKIAKLTAKYTGVTLKSTDPIIGTGVNSISTGTPFLDTKSFQPFDPEIIGVEQEIYVTQLANKRLIAEKAKILGYEFDTEQTKKILAYVKKTAYERNKSIFSDEEVKEIFDKFSGE